MALIAAPKRRPVGGRSPLRSLCRLWLPATFPDASMFLIQAAIGWFAQSVALLADSFD